MKRSLRLFVFYLLSMLAILLVYLGVEFLMKGPAPFRERAFFEFVETFAISAVALSAVLAFFDWIAKRKNNSE